MVIVVSVIGENDGDVDESTMAAVCDSGVDDGESNVSGEGGIDDDDEGER